MKYKMTKWYTLSWSVEVEADSLEEAKEMFDNEEWYEDEPQEVSEITYSEYDEDNEEWNLVEE